MNNELVRRRIRIERDEFEKVLRQIASRKRRTVEQRLASSCISFFDALREQVKQKANP